MRTCIKILYSILIFCALTLGFSDFNGKVNAQSPVAQPQQAEKKGLEVDPAFQEVTISPQEREKNIIITLTNHQSESINLELFPVTFNPRDSSGLAQFEVDESGSYSYSLSSYIVLPYRDITLQPGEHKDVQLIIQNRQDMPSGGTYVALIARQKKIETSDTATILPSISSMIFIHKTGGEIYNLRLKDISFPNSPFHMTYPKHLKLTFQNEGNIHLIPRGRVEIRDVLGRLVAKGVINTASAYVFPSSQRSVDVQLDTISTQLPISLNTITVQGTDSLHKTTFILSDTFLYIHPLVVAGISLISILFMYYLWICKRRNIS